MTRAVPGLPLPHTATRFQWPWPRGPSCMHARTHTHLHTRAHTCAHTHLHARTCTRAHTHCLCCVRACAAPHCAVRVCLCVCARLLTCSRLRSIRSASMKKSSSSCSTAHHIIAQHSTAGGEGRGVYVPRTRTDTHHHPAAVVSCSRVAPMLLPRWRCAGAPHARTCLPRPSRTPASTPALMGSRMPGAVPRRGTNQSQHHVAYHANGHLVLLPTMYNETHVKQLLAGGCAGGSGRVNPLAAPASALAVRVETHVACDPSVWM